MKGVRKADSVAMRRAERFITASSVMDAPWRVPGAKAPAG
jgi:hypothetical protein